MTPMPRRRLPDSCRARRRPAGQDRLSCHTMPGAGVVWNHSLRVPLEETCACLISHQPAPIFGGHLDAGETAAADDRRVAGGRRWPVRQGMQVTVERDRVVELIDAETVLRQARDVRLET